MKNSQGALKATPKITPCEKVEETNATNCNADKVRIKQLQEALNKLLRNPENVKKAAHIIEEMLHSSAQNSNK